MADAHLYVLWSKPGAIEMWQWKPLMQKVYQKLNRYGVTDPETGEWSENLPANVQPPHRLHYRTNNDESGVIIECLLDLDNVDMDLAASWLTTKINQIEPPIIGYEEDGSPVYADDPRPYTEDQVKAGLQNRVTLFAGKNATWEESRQAAAAYIAANAEDWGEMEVV